MALLTISGIVHQKFHIYLYIYMYTSRPNTHLNLGLPAPLTKDQFQWSRTILYKTHQQMLRG